MSDPLVETWEIHNRINFYLLDAVSEEALSLSMSPKHRNIFKLFAHMHNVRRMWVEAAGPEFMKGIEKIADETGKKNQLKKALTLSGKAMARVLEKALLNGGKVPSFKPHATAFLAYAISHESHHRGQIGWTLKFTGHPLPQKIGYGLWEWGVR
ncbi:MAG: hypothetical protein EXR99_11610 [Gemmataceae bacterium]|nr:hypothetical protein [Gemmataceae bacterium]